jgi:hypothetical protein
MRMRLASSVKDGAIAMIDLVAEGSTEVAFEDVMCYLGWWDCPRSGVALIGASRTSSIAVSRRSLTTIRISTRSGQPRTRNWQTRSKHGARSLSGAIGMTLAAARRHFLGPRPANACKSAGMRVHLPPQERPFPNGAWTGTARSRAACRNTRSAGSSLTGLARPRARGAA